jgi:hypothetical protein
LGQFYKYGAKQICTSPWRTRLSGVHRTVSGAQAGEPKELAALGNSQSSMSKNHRTSGEPTSNGHLRQRSTVTRLLWVQNIRRSEAVCDVRSHQTVQCATGLSGAPQGQTKSTVDCSKPQQSADVARNGLSGVPVDKEHIQRLE